MRRMIVLLVLACLWLPGCAKFAPPSDGRRAQSFAALAQAQAGGEPLKVFLGRRTAVLIRGSVTIAEAAADVRTLAMRFKPEPGKALIGHSHAVAIDARGYFLTAAHCVGEAHMYLVYFDGQTARLAVPRVVAKVQDEENQRDYAIIHVDATLPCVFDWSSAGEMAAGRTAVAAGSAEIAGVSDSLGYCAPACMAGRVLAATEMKDGTVVIAGDLPLRPGDSGGPLATVEGRLLGINRSVYVAWTGAMSSIALRPNPAWVAQAIAADLKEPHDASPAMANTLQDKRAANLVVTLW